MLRKAGHEHQSGSDIKLSATLTHKYVQRRHLKNLQEKMVGPNGLEPSTSSVSRKRSNQLSYGPTERGHQQFYQMPPTRASDREVHPADIGIANCALHGENQLMAASNGNTFSAAAMLGSVQDDGELV